MGFYRSPAAWDSFGLVFGCCCIARPEEHARLSKAELEYIRSDPAESQWAG